jgi:hypothetical protein
MFSSQKILKPDVPPKRHNTAPGFLGRLFRLLPFSGARQPFSIRSSMTEKASPEQRKLLGRSGT